MKEVVIKLNDGFDKPSTTITKVDLAFPARGASPELLPRYNTIPDEFKLDRVNDENTSWISFQSLWFSRGLPETLEMYPREGIDAKQAFEHLSVLQGSFGSKHEHKMAAVAWLASRWFSGYSLTPRSNGA